MNAGVIVSGPDCHFGYSGRDCAMLERLSESMVIAILSG